MGSHKSERYLRRVARILVKKKLLVNATAQIGGNPAPYYYLSRAKDAKKLLSRLLDVPEDQIGNSHTRYTHFDHEDTLARIQFEIESKFVGAITIRDWQLSKSEVPELVFPRTLSSDDFYPDLIVGIPAHNTNIGLNQSAYRWAAVELERHQKNHARVKIKLRDYAERTGLDGVLYILPNNSLEKKYQQYFREKAAVKALQLRGLEDSFFATTHLPKHDISIFSHNLNFGDRKLSVYNWFDFLRRTTKQNRGQEWKSNTNEEDTLA